MQLDRLENKIDKLYEIVCEYMVKQEARLSKIETIQRAFIRISIIIGIGGVALFVNFIS